jgi:L-amino acid N-acyltransferase YncA
MSFKARAARPDDAAAIARIYNEGIADRIATFETTPRTLEHIEGWFDGRYPIVGAWRDCVVVERLIGEAE